MKWFVDIVLIIILSYTFLYPIFMTFFWIIGSVLFEIRYRRRKKQYMDETYLEKFTVVIPVYNEEATIYDSIMNNLSIAYRNVEFVIINDCSTDGTLAELKRLKSETTRMQIVDLQENQGKAQALNYVITNGYVKTNYMIVIDSDTRLTENSLDILSKEIYNENDEKVIAYTGNVTVNVNEDSHLLKMQKLEYRSIIGAIKKSQEIFFKNIMTISGAIAVFNVDKLKEIGLFNTENATEDIEITWRLSAQGYRARFLSDLNVDIYSPVTKYSLIKQRARWTLGGMQTLGQNKNVFFKKGHWDSKLFFIESILSAIWIFCFLITEAYIFSRLVFAYPSALYTENVILPTLILLVSSLILLTIAYILDKGDVEGIWDYLRHAIYYPIVYWFAQPAGYLGGVWERITLSNKQSGKWRGSRKRELYVAKFLSFGTDVLAFSLIIFLWKMVVKDLVVWLPNEINTLYMGVIIYWIGYALIFNAYLLQNKYATFGESCFGLRSVHPRHLMQNLGSVIAIGYIIMNVMRFDSTLYLLNQTDYYVGLAGWVESTQSVSFNIEVVIVIILGSLERLIGVRERVWRNKIVDEGEI